MFQKVNFCPLGASQLIVLLGLEIYGPTYFQLNPGVIGSTDIPNADLKFLNTIIFNTFVLMQLFNEFNARKVNNGGCFFFRFKDLWRCLARLSYLIP